MIKPSSFTFNKLDFFDGIELFEASQDIEYFPFHSHDSFCVSIITSGTEIFENKDKKIIIPADTISITQANEIHKNSSLSEIGYSYKTIYVNPELLAYFNNGEKVNSIKSIINDNYLFNQINNLFEKQSSFNLFEETLKNICHYKNGPIREYKTRFSIDIIENLIEKDFVKTIDIDCMARNFHLSNYHFIREFKKQTGITPQAYITLFKLKKAKENLKHGEKSIKDITYDYGFYDLSHFSKTFKKFYGVSPSQYQKAVQNSNSIQLKS